MEIIQVAMAEATVVTGIEIIYLEKEEQIGTTTSKHNVSCVGKSIIQCGNVIIDLIGHLESKSHNIQSTSTSFNHFSQSKSLFANSCNTY